MIHDWILFETEDEKIKWWKLDVRNALWCGDPGSIHRKKSNFYVFYKKKNLKKNKSILVYGLLGRYAFMHTNEKSPTKCWAINNM